MTNVLARWRCAGVPNNLTLPFSNYSLSFSMSHFPPFLQNKGKKVNGTNLSFVPFFLLNNFSNPHVVIVTVEKEKPQHTAGAWLRLTAIDIHP